MGLGGVGRKNCGSSARLGGELLLVGVLVTLRSMQREDYRHYTARHNKPSYTVRLPEPNKDVPKALLHEKKLQNSLKKTKFWRRAAIILLATLTVGLAGWQGYKVYQRRQFVNQIPQSIRERVDFPIYLPASPKFVPDKQSFSYSGGVLLFVAGNDARLTFAEQQKPASFDLSKFSAGVGLEGPKQLTVKEYTVLLGNLKGMSIAVVDTGQTIVTITGGTSEPYGSMEAVIQSLRKI